MATARDLSAGTMYGAEVTEVPVATGSSFGLVIYVDPGHGTTRRFPSCRNTFGKTIRSVGSPRRGSLDYSSGIIGDGGLGEPGRFSRAHEGVAYGCCVPALTRFTNPHCPGPPRLT